jgi:hypothetical protein
MPQQGLSYENIKYLSPRQIAAQLGFDPSKYGNYFTGWEAGGYGADLGFLSDVLNAQKGLTELQRQGLGSQETLLGQSYNLQQRGAVQEGTQGMSNILGQYRQGAGLSGFSGFGAAQKSLEESRASLTEIFNRGLVSNQLGYNAKMGELGRTGEELNYRDKLSQLEYNRGELGLRRSLLDEAFQTGRTLLQSGAEANYTPVENESGSSDGVSETGDVYPWMMPGTFELGEPLEPQIPNPFTTISPDEPNQTTALFEELISQGYTPQKAVQIMLELLSKNP